MLTPVIPAPLQARALDGTFRVRSGRHGTSIVCTDPSLLVTVRIFRDDLEADTGIRLTIVESEPADGAVIAVGIADDGLDGAPQAGGRRADGRADADERYGLEVTRSRIRVWGAGPEGVQRGLTSLRQLVIAAAAEGGAEIGAQRIVDGPRFAWRGLSLDIARHFHGPGTIRRVLDICVLFKINVLHLHLSDDQGWRIELPGWPLLTNADTAGADGWLSSSDIAELVAYAADRFVTIVPEVDLPGHTAAALRAYPQLGFSGAGGERGRPPTIAALDPASDLTWSFVTDVVDTLIEHFPHSAYVHLGGDEALGMPETAYASFIERAAQLVRDRGRGVLGWQETARAGVRRGDLVQYWMDADGPGADAQLELLRSTIPAEVLPLFLANIAKAGGDLPAALEQGADILVSLTSRLYLDRPHHAPSADAAQEATRRRLGLPVYVPASLRDGVEWDPVDETPLVEDDSRLVGVEAAVWCETVTSRDDLELLLLPRLAGAAEKGWATRGITDWQCYRARLAAQSGAWDRRGWAWYRSTEVDWADSTPN